MLRQLRWMSCAIGVIALSLPSTWAQVAADPKGPDSTPSPEPLAPPPPDDAGSSGLNLDPLPPETLLAQAELPAPPPTAAATPMTPEARREALRREIGALEAIVAGQLPDGVQIRSLFEVNLDDESAVQARVQLLRARIQDRAQQIQALRGISQATPSEPAAPQLPSIASVEGTGDGTGWEIVEGTGQGTGEGTGAWRDEGTGQGAGWQAMEGAGIGTGSGSPEEGAENTTAADTTGSPEGTGALPVASPGSPTDAAQIALVPEGNAIAGAVLMAALAGNGVGPLVVAQGTLASPIVGHDLIGEAAGEAAETEAIEAEAGAAPASTTALGTAPEIDVDLLELQNQRDRLRLRFLTQARETRRALLEAETMRNRIIQSELEAARSRRDAEATEMQAEEARQAALLAQQQAEDAVARDLAGERARVEETRGLLAGLRREFAGRLEQQALLSRQRFEAEDSFRQSEISSLSPSEADAAYGRLVTLLTLSRRQLSAALDLLDAESEMVQFEPRISLNAPPYVQAGRARDELLEAIAQVREQSALLHDEEIQNRWDVVDELAGFVRRMNAVRLSLLPEMSDEKRSAVLGLSREGLAQLGREIEQLRLMTRYYLRQRARSLRELGSRLSDVDNLTQHLWTVVELALLLVAIVLLWRRAPRWVQLLRGNVTSRLGTGIRDLVLRWLTFAQAVGPWIGFLIAIKVFFALIGADEVVELGVVEQVLVAYGWYRVALAATHHLVTAAATAREMAVSAELSHHILRSVRVIGRYVFGVVVFLLLSEVIFGHGGYLYGLVVDFAWLGAFPIAFVLIQRWRTRICDAYLRNFPQGRLAAAVKRTRDRRIGFLVAAAAFAYVAVRGIGLYFRGFAMRFEQTRRALSYLFRRRLEKQAEQLGRAKGDTLALPAALREAFSEDPVASELRIQHYPSLDAIEDAIELWLGGGMSSAVALVGERGIGKSTWLAELAGRVGDVAVLHNLQDRITTPQECYRLISQVLGLPPEERLEALAESLRGGPRRLILLDQCQNLTMRAVGGMQTYAAFADLVGLTAPQIFWVCSFSRYAWYYVERVYLGRNVFRQVEHLEPWSEAAIGELIARRMEQAGYQATFDELVIGQMEGVDFQNEVIRTGDRYRRLVWDYADGLPRVALHFWMKSLSPGGDGQVSVRLFEAPDPDELESLQEQTRFVLATLVAHENLSVAEATRILGYPQNDCDIALRYLASRGILEEAGGRYRVGSHWHRAAVRYLRRKHLLF